MRITLPHVQHRNSAKDLANANDPIRSQFCTCQAVVKCAKLWPVWIVIFPVIVTRNFTKLGR